MRRTTSRQNLGLLLPVYVPTFLLTFSQGILIPTLPIYAQSYGLSYVLVSLVVATAGLGTMVADIPVGTVMNRVGRKSLMVAGTGSLALSTLLMALAHTFPELIAFRLMAGVGTAMWNISRLAYMAEVIPISDRGRALSTFGGLNRVGVLVGPAIGGLIGSQFGLSSSFLAAAALNGLALLVSLIFVPETGKTTLDTGHVRWRAVGRLLKTNFRDLGTAGAAQIFAQMIRNGRQYIIPIYGASILHLDVGAVGAIISIAAAVDVSLFIPAGYVMDRFGRKFASVPSFLILGLGMGLVPFAGDYYGLLFASCVMALGNGLGSGTMMTLGADLAPREATGEFFGLWRLIGDVGAAGGPMAVGGIADAFGLSAAAFALAAIGLVAAATLQLFVRETLQAQPPHSPT